MNVGSLFAEIGFKVDDTGLQSFSNAMKSFQDTIKSGVKELKAYAQAAREISDAMKSAYIPDQKEAKARYRAETRQISATARQKNANARRINAELAANLPALRAKYYAQDSETRRKNADARLRQTELKERGVIGTNTGNATNNLLRMLYRLVSISFGKLFGSLGAFFGENGAIIGSIVDKIIGAVWKSMQWLGKTILSGLKVGMKFRDYREFTGRSAGGLSKLMAGTFNTSSMSPTDILKDAMDLETQFWDMWFGGGNPRLWQLLGVMPTGNGETDLQSIVNRIGDVTNGFENVGLARSMFKMAGLSEDYIPMARYIAKERNTSVDLEIDRLMEMAPAFEEANVVVKQFSWELDVARAMLVEAFVKNGGLETVKKIIDVLKDKMPEIIQAFSRFTTMMMNFVEWIQDAFPDWFKTKEERQQEKIEKLSGSKIAKKGEETRSQFSPFKETDLLSMVSPFRPFEMVGASFGPVTVHTTVNAVDKDKAADVASEINHNVLSEEYLKERMKMEKSDAYLTSGEY